MSNAMGRRLHRATVILVLLAGSARLQSQVEFDRMPADGRDIRTVKVANGIYQFMTMRDSYVRQLNSVAVITDKDVLVFDTTRGHRAPRSSLVASGASPTSWYGSS